MNKPKIPKINSKKKNNKKTDTIITKENDSSKNFFNYKKYCDTMNTNKLLCPDLRNELMNDTRNLIDRINMNYDLTSWNKFDTRTTLNRFFQNEFSPISKVIKTSPNIRDKFIETLNKKASGLTTVNIQVKKNNLKRFYNKNDDSNDNKNNNEDKALDKLLDKNKSNLTKLKYNNTTNLEYNEQDKMFIKENEYITKKLNKTKLFSQFPSKTREEFNTKKIFKYKELFKINKPIKNLIQKEKYGDDNDIDNYSNKSEKNTFYKQMWTRPLHKDAFKLSN
jgi:cell division protein ZapA (FtsZ GTPase activity inhibitor)